MKHLRIFCFLLEKEIATLRRNSFLVKVCVLMPLAYLFIFPYVADMDVKHVAVAVVDNDCGSYSRRVVEKVRASDYFRLVALPPDYATARRCIEEGTADLILEIPAGFERRLTRGEESAALYLAANAVNGTRGALGLSYLSSLLSGFAAEVAREQGKTTPTASIAITPQYRFNRTLNYQTFMVPGMMAVVITMLSCFLPALSVVTEKESGTIEQMNVSPVPRWAFIVAKLVPYWALLLVSFTLALAVGWGFWGVVPQGSLLLLYGVVLFAIFTMSTFGVVISNLCETIQQATFVMFFFAMFFILLSGLFTPIYSMPAWAQDITYANPLRYFVAAMRGIVLKGSTFADVLPQTTALAGFFGLFLLTAFTTYRKTE